MGKSFINMLPNLHLKKYQLTIAKTVMNSIYLVNAIPALDGTI